MRRELSGEGLGGVDPWPSRRVAAAPGAPAARPSGSSARRIPAQKSSPSISSPQAIAYACLPDEHRARGLRAALRELSRKPSGPDLGRDDYTVGRYSAADPRR
ncbi:hypothetical protein PBY51_014533 [Eleginops maclovinus]|uniref:Uncharacterized protein n=1 Tax=Eleginops maclovinus TaxID=56733 RepID=A0AAN7WZX4_ELEMC|nr:hypothetical protein PBY51_014533 [Eleginops maclovinus]